MAYEPTLTEKVLVGIIDTIIPLIPYEQLQKVAEATEASLERIDREVEEAQVRVSVGEAEKGAYTHLNNILRRHINDYDRRATPVMEEQNGSA